MWVSVVLLDTNGLDRFKCELIVEYVTGIKSNRFHVSVGRLSDMTAPDLFSSDQ